jgi:hypothetical protein
MDHVNSTYELLDLRFKFSEAFRIGGEYNGGQDICEHIAAESCNEILPPAQLAGTVLHSHLPPLIDSIQHFSTDTFAQIKASRMFCRNKQLVPLTQAPSLAMLSRLHIEAGISGFVTSSTPMNFVRPLLLVCIQISTYLLNLSPISTSSLLLPLGLCLLLIPLPQSLHALLTCLCILCIESR